METPPLPAGTTIGPWTLLRALGRGANATVYVARRGTRELALKLRKRGEAELDVRFLREFEALRGLAIPGVVRVHDAGLDDGWLWYAMDIVHGVTLRSWIEAGDTLAGRVERLLRVGPVLCDALAAIHRAGMIHRDLKPGNVLVDDAGNPHILDFGVVRWGRAGAALTSEGGLVGTLPFMAPEQIAGQPLTPRADVFAVGLMFYEGIAGKRTRPARAQDWLRIQCLERPTPLAARHVEVPRALGHLLERMTALDPDDRPHADEAAAQLRACAQGRAANDWPAPGTWVGPAPAWQAPRPEAPIVRILAGPAGSGKRRTAEQIRRRATLAGARTVRGRCRIECPGGALEEILDALLATPTDEAWRQRIAGPDAAALLEMWSHLPLTSAAPHEVDSPRDMVRACADALARAATNDELVIVVEDIDEVDALTARVLAQLARMRPPHLSLVWTYDDRGAVRRARKLVDGLVAERFATLAPMPDLSEEEARALAMDLVPNDTPVHTETGSPLRAVEAGWEALAGVRGERFPSLPLAAIPAALIDVPLHASSWAVLGVEPNIWMARGALSIAGSRRWAIRDPAVRRGALARMPNRVAAARRLLEALEADPDRERTAGARARALLLLGETTRAFEPAVTAALHAEREGNLRVARTWLHLVDTLPRDRESDVYARLRFPLAWCRATVAAESGSERPRPDLVALAASRAVSPAEHDEVELLHADLRRREGDPRGALALLLRYAGTRKPVDEDARTRCVRALLAAAEVRLELGQPDDAELHLDRAAELRGTGVRVDRTGVMLDQLRADVAMARGDIEGAVRTCHAGLRAAGQLGWTRGLIGFYQRFGQASLFVGDRPQADEAETEARRLALRAGERALAAVTALHLGQLALGRGDSPSASGLAREALAAAQRLGLVRVRHHAWALLLDVATVRNDAELAAQCLAETESARSPAFAVAAQRWSRAWGDGSLVESPHATGYRAAELLVEQARTLAERGGAPAEAARRAAHAGALARGGGYRELQLYAEVVAGWVTEVAPSTWSRVFHDAMQCRWLEVCLCALAVDAARLARHGDHAGARSRVLELRLRAEEPSHRPAMLLAERLQVDDPTEVEPR